MEKSTNSKEKSVIHQDQAAAVSAKLTWPTTMSVTESHLYVKNVAMGIGIRTNNVIMVE